MSTSQTHLPTQSVVVGITIGVLILLVVALFLFISQTKLSRSRDPSRPTRPAAASSGPSMILRPIPTYPNTAPPPSPSASAFATLHRWDSTFKVGGPESTDDERDTRDKP
ncbi:hypothetical protein JCM21900_006269, partial [Sporobolomyces salmonicolor]